jgi:predicted helicase
MPTTIHSILAEFREAAISKREMGDKFERLIATYLQTDPQYKDLYGRVWLWTEWPDHKGQDAGIDLVAKERYTGEYCAIQCKFYDPESTLQKADIDSFFTASGKAHFASRMIISTTDKWSSHAEEAMVNQKIPVTRLRVEDLANSPIDWSKFSIGRPEQIKVKEKKVLRDHQKDALNNVISGLKEADRGKLIMACGTGKTFTSLKIAEKMVGGDGNILFLVPSISLMSQSLREWTSEADKQLHCFAVCSDTKVVKSKGENEDIGLHDLAFPATTDHKTLTKQMQAFKGKKQLNVIFSTYQSIKVISDAQKHGAPGFDLVICDEAHRTTGVTLEGEDESHFVKIHDKDFIKAKKRLYMTATPRIYSDDSKTKAKEHDVTLCSMDDEALYGKELHRLDFSEAVRRDLLSDYKVMVLAVNEKYVSKVFQKQLADADNILKMEDAVKITGCWNGLSKRMAKSENGKGEEVDSTPMRRAVAFSSTIAYSKKFTEMFCDIIQAYKKGHDDDETFLSCEAEHVDGTFNALERNKKLDWLKEDTTNAGNVCRILSNARCLSEGVDVPALDAVMFLNPRNSVVDVVQSVGRVMRKSPGKKYGYIILPIGIPSGMEPEEALKDNQKYKIVWQVLQALRAHDNRFNATVNQIELNTGRPANIQVIGVGGEEPGEGKKGKDGKPVQLELDFPNLEEWRDAIYAKIVLKCGDRRYWEDWAKDVAQIADRHISRITALLEDAKPKHQKAFEEFLTGLRDNLNPSIDRGDAIEMLSQHLITKPVFDALFEGYQFTKQNPVSIAMQKMLDLLEDQSLEKETASLAKFYDSVKERASGINNAAGKQKIIIELYDNFFKAAFPRMAERLGIVYTPIEVVDFIIHSIDHILQQEFNTCLSDKGVNLIDPFTGTGTFIVRLLQSGLIKDADLKRKYLEEIHANEIVLLAYYIAAINIEEAYHGRAGGEYKPFEGIVLTDTFQISEGRDTDIDQMFPENNKRVKRQQKKEIRVVMGNPPYSALQGSENDGNKNLKYPQLDDKIRTTYAAHSTAVLKNSLYDSYMRAFRWASNRIGKSGVICYVTNGSFIDGNAMDGFRKCLFDEFTSIYCFNLRGNQRTQGELSRKEGGKIFGSGSRASIAITLLVKNADKKQKCQLYYHDIGDYLTREQKIKTITEFGSVKNIKWQKITPNESHDWINKRDPAFADFIPLGAKDDKAPFIFKEYLHGLKTNRDAWVFNYSKLKLSLNVKRMIDYYNTQSVNYNKIKGFNKISVDDFIDNNPINISWSVNLKTDISKTIIHKFVPSNIIEAAYRPYCKQYVYFDRYFNERVSKLPFIFPINGMGNMLIHLTGQGSTKEFSALITSTLPDYEMISKGHCFPLRLYNGSGATKSEPNLFNGDSSKDGIINGISDNALDTYKTSYSDSKITHEDLYYYVYGILHSIEYKERFSSDLSKMLPRIPFAEDFWAFSKAGRALAKWHLNYETVEPYPLKQHNDKLDLFPKELYRVQKMYFGKNNKEVDKTTIIYNSHITLSGIPLEAYEYVVNGRPALEWIMERYQVTKDADSGIENDPNDWSEDPQYILNLVKRIVRVSLETMKIVNGLPALKEKK